MSETDRERKRALVTGASRGIGRATALELARQGYDIIINYLRNDEAAQETLQLIQEQGVQGWLVPAHVGEPAEIKRLIEEVSLHGPLDVLIHNAAIGTFKNIFDIRPNQLDLAFRVNAFALLWLTKEAVPLMQERGGKIIAISSMGSQRVVPYYSVIGPSKAALESIMRYLAYELRPQGIIVNAVSGGLIETDVAHAFPNWDGMVERVIARTPARRSGQPEDIAQIVGSLVSGKMDWVCGQIIMADGGTTL